MKQAQYKLVHLILASLPSSNCTNTAARVPSTVQANHASRPKKTADKPYALGIGYH